MAAKPLPPAEYLHQCFDYDPVTGSLTWRPSRPREHFKTDAGWITWLRRYAGHNVGSISASLGYVDVNLGGQRLYAHRIIWKMMTGEDPLSIIDHHNSNRADNRWSNLRQATKQQNQWNNRAWDKNRLLPRGVWARKKKGLLSGRYSASASHNDKHVHLGTFDTPEEAGAAYRAYVAKQRGDFGVG